MEYLTMRAIVENYKKTQRYAMNMQPVSETITAELKQDLEEYREYCPGKKEKMQLIAKVIAYLEFGFPYETHRALFEKILALCGTSRDALSIVMDRESQYVKLSKINLQKIIIWKSDHPSRYCNKGDIIETILQMVKEQRYGDHFYETDRCGYCLTIGKDIVLLKDLKKEIIYYLI